MKNYNNRDLEIETLVENSGLFDPVWYLSRYPELSGKLLLEHYILEGGKEGLSPGPNFDGSKYLTKNPDVAAADMNPLVHYLMYGIIEGRNTDVVIDNTSNNNIIILNQHKDIIENSGLFDSDWYSSKYPEAKELSPLEHYLIKGGAEGLSPGPKFDGSWYLKHYKDVAENGINPLLHYLLYGQFEGRLTGLPNSTLEALSANITDFGYYEPKIIWNEDISNIKMLSIIKSIPVSRVASVWNKIFHSINHNYKRIIFLSCFSYEGANLIARNTVQLINEMHGKGSVLIVLTDKNSTETREIFLEDCEKICLSSFECKLDQNERISIVETIIFSLKPEKILNINSQAFWNAVARRGKALTNISELYAAPFYYDYESKFRKKEEGDKRFLSCLDYLTKVYIDNRSLIANIIRNNFIPEALHARIAFLPQAIKYEISDIKYSKSISNTRLKVLCSDDIDKSTICDLLILLAQAAPHIDFHFFSIKHNSMPDLSENSRCDLSNLKFHYALEPISVLASEYYDAYIFFNGWKIIPHALLTIANRGIPIIAPDINRSAELVDKETGWLIRDVTNIEEYVSTLDKIWHQPQDAQCRASAMIERLRDLHSWNFYVKNFTNLPSFI